VPEAQAGTATSAPAEPSAPPGEQEARAEPFSNLPDHALPKLSEIEHTKHLAPGTHFLDPKGVRRKIPNVADQGGTETLYRGQLAVNPGGEKGGMFLSPDKEFARQFTQSGRDSEIKTHQIRSSDIHEPKSEVSAGDPDAVDKAVSDAKASGKKAVRLSEGKGQPPSVFVFK
jgi:hypothetical protein